MLDKKEIIVNSTPQEIIDPFMPEIRYVEQLIAEQDIESAMRIITNLRVAANVDRSTRNFLLTMIELLEVECKAVLGLVVSESIDVLLIEAQNGESDWLVARLKVIQFLVLINTGQMDLLTDFVDSKGVPESLRALAASFVDTGVLSPEVALGVTSPLARTLYQHCLLGGVCVAEVPNLSRIEIILEEVKTSLGKKLPLASILPVTIWIVERYSLQAKWLEGLINRDLGGREFPIDSYGWLYANAKNGIQLAQEGRFDQAHRVLSSLSGIEILDRRLVREIYQHKILCMLNLKRASEAVEILELILRFGRTSRYSHIWSEHQLIQVSTDFLSAVEPTKDGVEAIGRAANRLIYVFGEGSQIVQKFRIHGSVMAMELGLINHCANLLCDYDSAIGLSPVPGEECLRLGHREVSRFLNGLSLWSYSFSYQSDIDLSCLTHATNEMDIRFLRSVQQLRHGNDLHDKLFDEQYDPIASADFAEVDTSTFSGARISLLLTLDDYNLVPSEISFENIISKMSDIGKHFNSALSKYLLAYSHIAAKRNMPKIASDIEKALSTSIAQEERTVQTNLQIEIARSAELRHEYRVAAGAYDKILTNNCHWIDSSSSLNSYVLYRAAYCWAMNFNYNKAISRVQDTLHYLEGTIKNAELIDLLSFAAQCCEHLGQRAQAADILERAIALVSVTSEDSARFSASLLLRAGRNTEELDLRLAALNYYHTGAESLARFVSDGDDDLITLRNREYFVGLALDIHSPQNSTFEVNIRTTDSPS